jgi:aspartyl-tRNA synthetase
MPILLIMHCAAAFATEHFLYLHSFSFFSFSFQDVETPTLHPSTPEGALPFLLNTHSLIIPNYSCPSSPKPYQDVETPTLHRSTPEGAAEFLYVASLAT